MTIITTTCPVNLPSDGPAKMVSVQATSYRLMRKRNGELVLQGAYQWTKGTAMGWEWKDIETVVEG